MADKILGISVEARSNKLDGQLRAAEAKFAKSGKNIEKQNGGAFNFGNVARAVALTTAGISIARTGLAIFRGEWERVADIVDDLPFGIGKLSKEIANAAIEVDGFAEHANRFYKMLGIDAGLLSKAEADRQAKVIEAANRAEATFKKQLSVSEKMQSSIAEDIRLLEAKTDAERKAVSIEIEAEKARRELQGAVPARRETIERLIERRRVLQIADAAPVEKPLTARTFSFRQLLGLPTGGGEGEKPNTRRQGAETNRLLRQLLDATKAFPGGAFAQ